MKLYHNSREEAYRCPFGAVPVGTSLTIALDAELPEGSRVFLRIWKDGEHRVPMVPDGRGRLSASVALPEEPGLLWYYFVIELPEQVCYYGRTAASRGGIGERTDTPPDSWQITVYRPQMLPGWYQNAVAYQIFPDRFHRGQDWKRRQSDAVHPAEWRGAKRIVLPDWDDTPFYCKDENGRVTRWPFFGGTLEGIREKLPYLRSLGVSVLYLNPIFTASSNHKYDTADYFSVDPGFGDDASFSALCAEAEQNGIRILLDGVFSHTGDDSIYFNRYGNFPQPGAFSAEESPYDSWYHFTDGKNGYAAWWGVDSLPEVEESDPDYREFICGEDGVIRHWLRLGASGWRLDVADELPDAFIAEIRRAERAEKPDALLLGEVWEDASNKVSYGVQRRYLLGEELDCTMHYPFRTAAAAFLLGRETAGELAEHLETIRENYPPSALYGALNLAGSHDTPRALTVLGGAPEDLPASQQERYRLPPQQRELGLQRLRLLQVLQFTSPGVPCIYYGDEAGAEGYADPYNRGPFPWGQADGDLTYWVRMLSHLRQDYPVLVQGDVRCRAVKEDVFCMRRSLGDARAEIFVNRSDAEQTVSLSDGIRLDLLTGNCCEGSLVLRPRTAAVLYREGAGETFSPLPDAVRLPNGRGLLCPIFSLPGSGPVGNLRDALDFLPILRARGDQNWMLLPLCPAGLGNSPYASPCVFAGDTRYVSTEVSADASGFDEFRRQNRFWLEDYALYTVLRGDYGTPWQEWPNAEKHRKNLPELFRMHRREILRIEQEQYRFFAQWDLVHRRAKELGVALIGDLPVYAALDSAETWSHPEWFQLDDAGFPTFRAGCPPDYFSPDGQDWGNPLYRWDSMQADGYLWWKMRFRQAFAMYDFVRLDHFRSFAAYYAVPAQGTAQDGLWMKGAGIGFFREMAREFGTLPVIAEDLGTLDSQVQTLLRHTGFPGMYVWQFSEREIQNLSAEEASRRVLFSGTHDNQTLRGFLNDTGDSRQPAEILRELCSRPAAAVILPVQDVLGLGDEARINTPGVPSGNWCWRMTADQLEFLKEGGIL